MKTLCFASAAALLSMAGAAFAQPNLPININVAPQIAVSNQLAIAMNVNASPATAISIGVLGGQAVALATTSNSQNSIAVNIAGSITQSLFNNQQ